MSTSPVTSPKASPSNNRELALAAYVSLGAIVFIALCEVPWRTLGGELREKSDARAAIQPLVDQAKLWPMTYETAEAGKPVVWCVDHPARDVAYLESRPSQPIVYSNDDAAPLTFGNAGSHCANVVAVVEGRKPQGVVLTFKGAL